MTLTFDDYKANLKSLEDLFKATIPKQWNRAHFKPEFDRVFVSPLDSPWAMFGPPVDGDTDADTLGIVVLSIIEMNKTFSYAYSIKNSGLILQRTPRINFAGGLTCYMEVIREWAERQRAERQRTERQRTERLRLQ